ncbi:MAG TPA: hypothetical protein VGQ25_05630 [Gemmatimonadales bacterium]|jgi:hypothetical protein|nr:hypothetical protein [Gemmatimonadales bacterium]
MTKSILGIMLLCAIAAAPMHGQAAPAQLVRFLRQSIGLDSAQLVLVERGDAVVKVLDTRDRRDVAVFGIVTTEVPRETYVAQVRDFRTSLRTPTRSRLGIFSDPATAADVEAVTISSRDVADMKDCRPGDCVVKLPATDMRRIHAEMDWSAADLQAQLSAYARRRLVEYVTDYRARGDSAMAVYDDRGNLNVRSSEAFAGLLAESPYVYQNVPSLGRYLSSYPREKLAGAAEVLFWSEDVMPRLRPILSVTHQVVFTPPELPGVTLVAAKQIYANHYFEAAVDLTCIVDRQRPDGKQGSYVLVFRRYRFDNMPSGGLLNIRGRAVGALRDQLLTDLRRKAATAEPR